MGDAADDLIDSMLLSKAEHDAGECYGPCPWCDEEERKTSMKAVSLIQPWASLIAAGEKRIETRSWPTHYRGPLAIHASKGFPEACRELCNEEPFRTALMAAFGDGRWVQVDSLPLGSIVAVCNLTKVLRTSDLVGKIPPQEREFGDYRGERFGWLLSNVVAVDPPIVIRGNRSLWDVPADIACHLASLVESSHINTTR